MPASAGEFSKTEFPELKIPAFIVFSDQGTAAMIEASGWWGFTPLVSKIHLFAAFHPVLGDIGKGPPDHVGFMKIKRAPGFDKYRDSPRPLIGIENQIERAGVTHFHRQLTAKPEPLA